MLIWHQSLAALFVLLFSSHIIAAETIKEGENKPIIFELEFIPRAELFKTANFLRTEGLSATVSEATETIVVEGDSYTKTLSLLAPLVPNLPDIARLIWKNGDQETVLYEAQEADLLVRDHEITDNRKVLQQHEENARVTVVLKDDKNSAIKYQNIVKKIENMGYKVTFAEGYLDAGWIQFPAVGIEIPNNIASFRKAILELSELPEVNRFMYNPGNRPQGNDYIITFLGKTDFDTQLTRLLANDIEVYKIDKLLNRLFIHFPQSEARNKIKLEQIKMLDDLVAIKNLHENRQEFTKDEYAKNLKHVWLDIPEELLKNKIKHNEYSQMLYDLARDEVLRLKQKGMIIIHYGVYTESGEVMIPEVTFTHRDEDTPKAKDILKFYNTNTTVSIKPKVQKASVNTCADLFAF